MLRVKAGAAIATSVFASATVVSVVGLVSAKATANHSLSDHPIATTVVRQAATVPSTVHPASSQQSDNNASVNVSANSSPNATTPNIAVNISGDQDCHKSSSSSARSVTATVVCNSSSSGENQSNSSTNINISSSSSNSAANSSHVQSNSSINVRVGQ